MQKSRISSWICIKPNAEKVVKLTLIKGSLSLGAWIGLSFFTLTLSLFLNRAWAQGEIQTKTPDSTPSSTPKSIKEPDHKSSNPETDPEVDPETDKETLPEIEAKTFGVKV